MSSARKRTARLAAFTVLGSLIITGCAQAQAQPIPAEPAATWAAPTAPATPVAPQYDLPGLSYETVVMTPSVDGFATATGEVARASVAKVAVHDAVHGNALGLLPATETVPIIQRTHGWVRVMLPSRRALPTRAHGRGGQTSSKLQQSQPINGGTAWIWEADVVIETGLPRLLVDKTAGQVQAISAAGQLLALFPATIGQDVPSGPTYIAPGVGVAGCSPAAPIKLSAQSETKDGYRGQPISPIWIDAPSPDCTYSAQDAAEMAPRMIQLSLEDAIRLAALLKPGVHVDIVDTVERQGVAA